MALYRIGDVIYETTADETNPDAVDRRVIGRGVFASLGADAVWDVLAEAIPEYQGDEEASEA